MVCEIEFSHMGKNGGNPDLVYMYKKRLYSNPLNTELTTMSLDWLIVHVLIKGYQGYNCQIKMYFSP